MPARKKAPSREAGRKAAAPRPPKGRKAAPAPKKEAAKRPEKEAAKRPKKEAAKRPKKERVRLGDETVPLFQLASMAQTRANAKVLRNVLSWVAVLAGYRPTPAEEMEAVGAKAVDAEVVEKRKAKGRAAGTAPAPAPPSEDEQCPFCGSADYVVSRDGLSAVCAQEDCGKGWNLGRK